MIRVLTDCGFCGKTDINRFPVALNCGLANMCFHVPKLSDDSRLGCEYLCCAARAQYSLCMLEYVSEVLFVSKIPPGCTESRNQSGPNPLMSVRSMALRKATSKQLIIVNISCETRRLNLYKVMALRVSFPQQYR